VQLQKFLRPDYRRTPYNDAFIRDALEIPDKAQHWETLAQAQFLEIITLLSGYLLSSQGDRMLMGHSVEGRFPFLDSEVMRFCLSLPASHKLVGLREKAVLKRLAQDILPAEIINRPKQPYRAPDAISFLADPPDYVGEMLSRESLETAGVFDPSAVSMLHSKCVRMVSEGGDKALLGNTDNMGMVGILSTQLLYYSFIHGGSVTPAVSHPSPIRIIEKL
jgi:asparagine synthase (glutamine-hydrolysing)